MTNKDKYSVFCETRDDIPVFSEPWWLDAVCVDGDWDVCIYEEKGHILGVLPYYKTTYFGFQVIRMPKLTPYLGIQFTYPQNLSPEKRYHYEQKITSKLIDQLPKVFFSQQIHNPKFLNWLPFYWAGFKQTTKYSFIFNIQDTRQIYSSFRRNLKRNLRIGAKTMHCEKSGSLKLFYSLHEKTFQRQGLKVPYTFDFLLKLDSILQKKKQRIIFATSNQSGETIATGYFVWDKENVYFLMSGRLNSNRVALSWTIWHAMQYFSPKVKYFDFSGSIIKNFAMFNNKFTSSMLPYHHITKGSNKLIDILKLLKP